METQTTVQLSADEQVLVEIVRHLPHDRVEQVIDFAKFIEWQISQAEIENLPSDDEADEASGPGDEQWARLLATPESERLLAQLAQEALEDFHSGRTTEIAVTKDGILAPR